MTSYSKGLHHYHIRKRIYQKHEPFPSKNKLKRNFDKLIYIAVIFGPIMTIPQLLKIWTSKNAAGVSFIAWASFSVISILWLTYGILHKEKPIIFMNLALIILQVLIAISALIYG
ncbi:MAG: hypothetical protein KJ646_01240 [Nanoarchaeota archaeon]|nr:hypothetical protein [Nanoarchaeota archaeon]MBU4116789.1 hypothetical protein [Nanoarchaeota archaeon]